MSDCSNIVPSLGGGGGYNVLADSSLYIAKAGAVAGNQITEFISLARCSEDSVDAALESLSAAYDAFFNTNSPNYNPNWSFVSLQYTPPSITPTRGNYASLQPTEVTLPAREGLLTDAQSDAIFARARSRITRAATAMVRSALEQPASLGIGMAAPAVLRRVAEANQKKLESTVQVALEQAAQEGVWEREDIKTILALELDNFKSKWTVIKERIAVEEDTLRSQLAQYETELKREAEKRGWTELQINTILKEELDRANTIINWGKVMLDKMLALDEMSVKMKAAVFQGWLQAANLSFSFQGQMSSSLTESI